MQAGERVQKVLALAGFGSRRACERLLEEGRVTVDGRPAELGSRVDVRTQRLEVDGTPVEVAGEQVHYVLHKPAGVVTTARDPQGRPTVTDLVPDDPRVFPVGRLDRDTTGLLLLTNDGQLAHRLMHPRHGAPKTYVAEVAGTASPRHLAKLRRGVQLEDGPARAETARVVASKPGRSVIELTVREGRNRMVRRMLSELGLPVVSLTRTSIGPLRLGRLKPGAWRKLSPREVHELLRATADAAESDRPGAGRLAAGSARDPGRKRSQGR